MDDLKRAEIIENGLASPFWKEVLLPMLQERKKTAERGLRNPSLTRKHSMPDDYLRGILDLTEMLIDHPPVLAETIRNAAVEEKLAETRDFKDDIIAHYGRGSLIED